MGFDFTDEYGNSIEPTDDELNSLIQSGTLDPNQFDYIDPETQLVSSYDEYSQPVQYVDASGNPVDSSLVEAGEFEPVPDQSESVIYQDADGNVISEDQINSGVYEVVPQVSPWEKFINSFASQAFTTREAYYGLKQKAGELYPSLGIDTEEAKRRAANEKWNADFYANQGTTGNEWADAGLEIAPRLPEAALAVLTGIPGALALGGKQFLETYGKEYSETGSDEASLYRAGGDALIDVATAVIPGGKLVKNKVGNYAVNAAATALGISTTNFGSGAIREFTQQKYIDKTEERDWSKVYESAKDVLTSQGKQTAILSAILPAVAQAGAKRNKALDADDAKIDYNQKFVDTEADVPVDVPVDAPVVPEADVASVPRELPDVMKRAQGGEVAPINILPPDTSVTALPTRRGIDGSDLSYLKTGIEDGSSVITNADGQPLVDAEGVPLRTIINEAPVVDSRVVDIQRTPIGEMMRQAESGQFPGRDVPSVMPDAVLMLEGYRDIASTKMEPESSTPIMDAIRDAGGIGGRRAVRSTGGEYDGAPNMQEVGNRYRDIYGGKRSADLVHQDLVDQGLLPSNSSIDDMWNAVRREARSERLAKQEAAKSTKFLREALYPTRVKREKALKANDLIVGDELIINGKPIKVVEFSQDGVYTLDGGQDYGIQRVSKDDVIFADAINNFDVEKIFDFGNYQIDDPAINRFLMEESIKLQQMRPAIGEGAKIDISSNAADLVKSFNMPANEAMSIANKANIFRSQLERKLAKTESKSEAAAIKAELERIDYLALDPDLIQRLREQEPTIEIYNTREALRRADALPSADDVDARMELDRGRGIVGNERGSINFEPVVEYLRKSKEGAANALTNLMPWDRVAKQLANDIKDFSYKGRPEGQDFFEGNIGGVKPPLGLQSVVESIRKGVNRATDLSRKFPDFKYAYDEIANKSMMEAHLTFNQLEQHLLPALSLPDTQVLNKVLSKIMKDSLDAYNKKEVPRVTKETLIKAGVTEDVAIATEGVLKANEIALDLQRDAYIERAKDAETLARKTKIRDINKNKELSDEVKQAEIEKEVERSRKAILKKIDNLNTFFEEIKITNYIPAMREGNIVIDATHKVTGEPYFDLAKDNAEFKTKVKNLAERGFEVKSNIKELPPNSFDSKLDPLTRLELDKMWEEVTKEDGITVDVANTNNVTAGKKFSGMRAHLLPRKGIEGYRTDLFEATVDYLEGMTGHAARTKYLGKRDLHLFELKNQNKNKIVDAINDYYNQIDNPAKPFWKAAMKIAPHYTMGMLDVSAGLVDFIGAQLAVQPELARYSKGTGVKDLAVALKDAVSFQMSRESFAKKNPELAKDLDYMIRAGRLGDQVSGLTDDSILKNKAAKGLRKKTTREALDQISMITKSVPDYLGRVQAFIGFYRNAPKGVSPAKFAIEMVDKTLVRYGAVNRAPMFNSKIGLHLGQMKEHLHNQIVNQSLSLTDLYGSAIDNLRAELGKTPMTKEQKKVLRSELMGHAKRAVSYPASTLAIGGLRASPWVGLTMALYSLVTDEKEPMKKFRMSMEELGQSSESKVLNFLGSFAGDMMVGGMFRAIPKSIGLEGYSMGSQLNLTAGLPDMFEPTWQDFGQFVLGPSTAAPLGVSKMIDAYKESNQDALYAFTQGAPRGLKTKLQAYYGLKDGDLRDAKGNTSVQDIQPEELIGLALGLQPDRKIDFYEGSDAMFQSEKLNKETETGFGRRLALAYEKGDEEAMSRLVQEGREAGMTENQITNAIKNIPENLAKMRSPALRMFKGAQNKQEGLQRLETLEAFMGANTSED